MNFPSKTYVQWEKDTLKQIVDTTPVKHYPIAVYMVFRVKDNRGRDIDNMMASILDMLQKSGIIESDDWQHCFTVSGTAKLDKHNPGALISITS